MKTILTLLALTLLATDASAGPRSRRQAVSSSVPSGELAPRGSVAWPIGTDITVYDGLDELNAIRRSKGLPAYIRDDTLTGAAATCAAVRASHGILGHLLDEYRAGGNPHSTGCAANERRHGFMACNDDATGYRYAGAVYVVRGNRMYCHLFVRN